MHGHTATRWRAVLPRSGAGEPLEGDRPERLSLAPSRFFSMLSVLVPTPGHRCFKPALAPSLLPWLALEQFPGES